MSIEVGRPARRPAVVVVVREVGAPVALRTQAQLRVRSTAHRHGGALSEEREVARPGETTCERARARWPRGVVKATPSLAQPLRPGIGAPAPLASEIGNVGELIDLRALGTHARVRERRAALRRSRSAPARRRSSRSRARRRSGREKSNDGVDSKKVSQLPGGTPVMSTGSPPHATSSAPAKSRPHHGPPGNTPGSRCPNARRFRSLHQRAAEPVPLREGNPRASRLHLHLQGRCGSVLPRSAGVRSPRCFWNLKYRKAPVAIITSAMNCEVESQPITKPRTVSPRDNSTTKRTRPRSYQVERRGVTRSPLPARAPEPDEEQPEARRLVKRRGWRATLV